MNDDVNAIPQPGEAPAEWRKYHWYPVLGGLAALALAAVVGAVAGDGPIPPRGEPAIWDAPSALRVLLCLAGGFAIGVGIWLRPASAPALAAATLGGLLTRVGFPREFDSGRMVGTFAGLVAATAAVLVALPRTYRRVGVIGVVLLHFGCILGNVTGPETGPFRPPWTTQMANTYVYRAYSQFIYMTNAYHFYSPEPGPASQVWFCIYYDSKRDPKTGEVVRDPTTGVPVGGDTRWFKLPRRPEDMTDPLALSYYRRLSLTMRVENYATFVSIPPEVYRRRDGRSFGPSGIPWHADYPREQQWRPPADSVRSFIMPSFVRFVTHRKELQHPDGVTPIKSVKVYRVEHRILPPEHIPNVDPYDLSTYTPYFQGEYDAEGRQINMDDPLLYWIVPIIYSPKSVAVDPWHTPRSHPNEFELIDGVARHAGSNHEE